VPFLTRSYFESSLTVSVRDGPFPLLSVLLFSQKSFFVSLRCEAPRFSATLFPPPFLEPDAVRRRARDSIPFLQLFESPLEPDV